MTMKPSVHQGRNIPLRRAIRPLRVESSQMRLTQMPAILANGPERQRRRKEHPRKNKTPGLLGTEGFENLERETRLELATPTLARSCSTN